jgi:hypothetical protein
MSRQAITWWTPFIPRDKTGFTDAPKDTEKTEEEIICKQRNLPVSRWRHQMNQLLCLSCLLGALSVSVVNNPG